MRLIPDLYIFTEANFSRDKAIQELKTFSQTLLSIVFSQYDRAKFFPVFVFFFKCSGSGLRFGMIKHPAKGMDMGSFLPTTREEMHALSIDRLDVIIVTGDAYIDHPAFGAAMVGRYLQSLGLTVGVIAMPDVKNDADFAELGSPRYFFGVTAGNVDSMLSLFTAQKKIRSDDPYAPAGKIGLRPQRATIAYCNALKRVYKNVPIIIGGVEASLRRLAHYDYWSDTVRQSILLDAKADMLIYGMAEKPLEAIVAGLKAGKSLHSLTAIPGTVIKLGKKDLSSFNRAENEMVELPSYESVKQSKRAFSEMTRMFFQNINETQIQHSGTCAVVINPPAQALSQKEIDAIYELPFVYRPHPSYKEKIPAYEQIKDSFVVVRGCIGGCNFCGLGIHQGKTIQSRSVQSISKEIVRRSLLPGWKGIVSDLGGPTANMFGLFCKQEAGINRCKRRSCLSPVPCVMLETNQRPFADLIRLVGAMKEVKHLFVNSGIRMDLALLWPEIIEVLAQKAVGGQMSVAPEHVSAKVLKLMNKPVDTSWERFEEIFHRAGKKAGKKQYLAPYLIAGHPGSSISQARELADYLKKHNIRVEQVQEFMPLPMTVSASMYYTGEDPFTNEPVEVSYKLSETRREKDTIMWWKKK
jgi:uncharacterized radical SAM protein YgiQ